MASQAHKDQSQGMVELEKEVLSFWNKKKIFQKSLNQTKKGKRYTFWDGPPYANGKPGIHHFIGRAFKDLWPRFKTMQGHYVERRAGWDTHGLPVEIGVEKELGFNSKKDIEKYGVKKFNAKAKESVLRYKELWEEFSRRTGHWIDLENAYVTYDPTYIESSWWVIKEFDNKGLLYEGHKILPWCPRCGTALSSHEVADGYKDVKDDSVYVKLKVKNPTAHNLPENTYLTAWTTTPWTLPGNVALAVGKNIDYVIMQQGNEHLIVAQTLQDNVLEGDGVGKKIKGSKLVGIEYEPLFDIPALQNDKSHTVYDADFVTTEDGTGIVHTAVMYGEDDYKLGTKLGLPQHHTVDPNGHFTDEVPAVAGEYAKKKGTEEKIFQHLRDNGTMLKVEEYEHSYPHCWRCKTALLYYARDSWFVAMSKLRKELVANNKRVRWVPGHLRDGRFGEFLKEARDWAFSRERYWGIPIPVWKCTDKDCDEQRTVGSLKDLDTYRFEKGKKHNWPYNDKGELDLHRPFVDEIYLKCDKCESKMQRVSEIADIWFDSGAMPYGQLGHPYKDSKALAQNFPADFLSEAIDQTRGWFYTLLAESTALGKGEPYRNVVCYGHVLDEHGKKMSKSVGNVVDPWDAMNTYGSDATRWFFYTVNSPGDSKNFAMRDVQGHVRGYLMTLRNTLRFLQSYGGTTKAKKISQPSTTNLSPLDAWLLSRLHSTIKTVTDNLEIYQSMPASRALEAFVMNDVSNWWVRRSRSRFQKAANKTELKQAVDLLQYVLVEVTKLTAPFTPFIADHMYRQMVTTKESVHLDSWPKANTKLINKKLEKDMEVVQEIVSAGLASRRDNQMRVRQPLASVTINAKVPKALHEYIADELNVKKVVVSEKQRDKAKLDLKLTDELKAEGYARDIARAVQELRKQAGYNMQDTVQGFWHTDDAMLQQLMEQHGDAIAQDTLLKTFANKQSKADAEGEYKFDDAELWLGVKK